MVSNLPDPQHLLNELVHVLEVDLGIFVLEVITHGDHDVVRPVVLGHRSYVAKEVIHAGLDVVVVALGVNNRIVTAVDIEAVAGRSRVVTVQEASEDFIVAQRITGIPDHFHAQVVDTVVLVAVIHAGEELSIISHLSEDRGLLTGVTEGIDLPTNAGTGAGTEGVVQESGINI